MEIPKPSKKFAAWAFSIGCIMALAKGRPDMTELCAILIAVLTVAYTLYQGLIDYKKVSMGQPVNGGEET